MQRNGKEYYNRDFANIKYFTRTILAYHHMLLSRISPGSCEIPFGSFLTTSTATIYSRSESLCVSLGTESKVGLR